MGSEITLEILLVAPPTGVGFCLQKGEDELIDYQVSEGKDIRFSLAVHQSLY